MGLIVQKFGGTSVANIECIRHVSTIVQATRAEGHQVIVVVSAMHGETDRLLQLTQQMGVNSARESDVLVCTGEQVSAALLSLALLDLGLAAESFSGLTIPLKTDATFTKARILDIDREVLRLALANNKIPVVAGFQGRTAEGQITTLGRGGSDTTAVAIAAALNADECQIYTDVDGVYTTDPRVVREARRLPFLTYEEMLEFSSLGAKVLQIRSVEFAHRYQVPLRVLSTFKPGPGTLIVAEGEKNVEYPLVSGIASNRNQAKLTIAGIPEQPGVPSCILGALGDANIDVDMIVQNSLSHENDLIDFSFTVSRDDYPEAYVIANRVAQELSAREVLGNNKIAKLSLIGVGVRGHAGVAAAMFRALSQEGIKLHLIATSEIKISVLIEEKYIELGVRVLHAAFKLDQEEAVRLLEAQKRTTQTLPEILIKEE